MDVSAQISFTFLEIMVFSAPDGTEFESKAEYRDYMMDTYYTFKNKKDDHTTLVKSSGEVDGQVFDLADCDNCTMIVMDNCEQVQMDKLVKCKVLIGACASSIFIRDCSDCVFYTSCKQLRVRDCTNCKFFSHCMSEIHIELSKGLTFGHLNCGYPDQADHMLNARLDASKNFWFDVYDHNDQQKKGMNWRLLRANEYDAPWFPVGGMDRVIAASAQGKAGSAQVSGQVGDAHKLEQMIADRDGRKVSPASPAKPKAYVGIETSLLVANAAARNIDVLAWLTEGHAVEKDVPMEHFRGKLHSLALLVAVEADEDSKAEIELGTNSDAMDKVVVDMPGRVGQCQHCERPCLPRPMRGGATSLPRGPRQPGAPRRE